MNTHKFVLLLKFLPKILDNKIADRSFAESVRVKVSWSKSNRTASWKGEFEKAIQVNSKKEDTKVVDYMWSDWRQWEEGW